MGSEGSGCGKSGEQASTSKDAQQEQHGGRMAMSLCTGTQCPGSASAGAPHRLLLQQVGHIGVAQAVQGLLHDADVLHPVDQASGAYPVLCSSVCHGAIGG